MTSEPITDYKPMYGSHLSLYIPITRRIHSLKKVIRGWKHT